MEQLHTAKLGENMIETQRLTFDIAEGAVDPQARIDRGEIRADRVDELVERLQTDEFIINGDPESIPCNCMDCRPMAGGGFISGPKAAGGSFTLTMGDALTTQSYRHPGEKAPVHHKRVTSELVKAGRQVGGHEADTVANEDDSGCGAQDKADSTNPNAPSILKYMNRKSKQIFGVINSIGLQTRPETEELIESNTAKLIEEEYITNGSEISAATKEVGGAESVKTLTGPQEGVVAAIITRPGEHYDMDAIAKEFGSQYQVFEISAWAIANGAKATSLTPEEAENKTVAGLAFNIAAGGVIAGPGMRLAIR